MWHKLSFSSRTKESKYGKWNVLHLEWSREISPKRNELNEMIKQVVIGEKDVLAL